MQGNCHYACIVHEDKLVNRLERHGLGLILALSIEEL